MATNYTAWVEQQFAAAGVQPAPGSISRIAHALQTGERTQAEVASSINWVKTFLTNNPDRSTDPGGHSLLQQDAPGSTPTQSFRDRAAAMFPWLQGQLLDTFANLWSDSGDANLALGRLRQTNQYLQQFRGIRREDGTLRMDENQFLGQKVAISSMLAEYGMQGLTAGQYEKLLQNEVNTQEFARAVGQFAQMIEPGSREGSASHRLFQEAVGGFMNSGSFELTMRNIRDGSTYAAVFPGMRRGDGTLRFGNEQEYFSYVRGFDRLFLNRGLDPTQFKARGQLQKVLEGEVSLQELDGRMSAIEQGVLSGSEETIGWFTEQYGSEGASYIGSSDAPMQVALAMAFDPDIGKDLLSRRISASQIGGAAAVAGYARGLARAERLASLGVTQSRAMQAYQQASQSLDALSAATRRFHRGETTLDQFEDAALLGDAGSSLRLERTLRSEQSQFSGAGGFRREGDALSGLIRR